MPPPRLHGTRTGHVDLLHYDQAVAEGLGAVLDETKNQYYIPIDIFIRPPGSDAPKKITKALVVYKQSEPTHTEFDVASIVINRDDISPARDRLVTIAEAYRVPAEGARQVWVNGFLGWTAYETKEQEEPFDFTYTLECWSRYRTVAQMLLQKVMVKYPLNGKLRVVDSLGVERVYHTFQEGTSDLTQVNTLVDRLVGFSLTLRVEGELTNSRVPIIVPGFTGQTVEDGGTAGGGGGSGGSPPDPEGAGEQPIPGGGIDPGAISGDGQAAVRVTAMGSEE